MTKVLLLYASHDGHTRKISTFLSEQLQQAGLTVDIVDLQARMPDGDQLHEAQQVVVLSAIRYGRPLKQAEEVLKRHRSVLDDKDLVLLSVNLTARKPEKRTPETSPYLRKWIERHTVTPAYAACIAGKLDYPSYGPFDRFMIRLIMTMTKGPTEPDACIEFTDWDQVRSIAHHIQKLALEPAN